MILRIDQIYYRGVSKIIIIIGKRNKLHLNEIFIRTFISFRIRRKTETRNILLLANESKNTKSRYILSSKNIILRQNL